MSNGTPPASDEVAESINILSIEVYKKINDNDENAIFSPFGVAMALAMLYIGSSGQTAEEIAKVLHFNGTRVSVSRGMKSLLTEFHNSFSRVLPIEVIQFHSRNPTQVQGSQVPNNNQLKDQLNIAAALWVQRDFSIEQLYRDLIKLYFGGTIFEADLNNPEQARNQINEWISKQTHGRINQAIPRHVFQRFSNPLQVGIINTIFFSGRWLYPFDSKKTQDQPFYLLNKQTITLPFMYLEEIFSWMKNDTIQFVELPYRGDALVMGIVLPIEQRGLPLLEKKLTLDLLLHLVEVTRRQKLQLYLPRFNIDSKFNFVPIFKQLGIIRALDLHDADFSGMTKDPTGVFLGNALHETCIEVDEEGTVAAALVGQFVRSKGISQPLTFKADHPFLFFIRHTGTGQILFMGRWTGINNMNAPRTE